MCLWLFRIVYYRYLEKSPQHKNAKHCIRLWRFPFIFGVFSPAKLWFVIKVMYVWVFHKSCQTVCVNEIGQLISSSCVSTQTSLQRFQSCEFEARQSMARKNSSTFNRMPVGSVGEWARRLICDTERHVSLRSYHRTPSFGRNDWPTQSSLGYRR